MGRKRARVVASVSSSDAPHAWTLHGDQRLVGVYCPDSGAATLVAAGPRHVQIRATDGAVGKLVAFESDAMAMGEHCIMEQQGRRTYVAYQATSDHESECAAPCVRVFDAVSMEFSEVSVPWLTHSRPFRTILNAFADDTGQRLILMTREEREGGEEAMWRLWCWRRGDHEREDGDWTPLKPLSLTGCTRHTWRASFFVSPLFGPCVLVVCLARKDDATWALEMWLLSTETEWPRVARRRQLITRQGSTDSEATPALWLAPSHMWALATFDDPHELCCVPVHLVGTTAPIEIPTSRVASFDAPVTDVTWCDDLGAVLLSTGAVRFVALPSLEDVEGALVLVDHAGISDVNGLCRVDMQRSSQWNKVLWVCDRREILAGCGSTVVSMQVVVEYEEETEVPALEGSKSTIPLSVRRRRRRVVTPEPGVNSLLARFSKPTSVSADEVLSVARVALLRADEIDVALTLVAIVLQRMMQRLGLGRTPDDLHIQVGITEMLLAQLVALDGDIGHRIARKIVQAPTFRSRQERRAYYADDVESLVSAVHCSRDEMVHTRHWAALTSTFGNQLGPLLTQTRDSTPLQQWLGGQGSLESKAAALLNIQERPPESSSAEWTLSALITCYQLACQFYGLDALEFDISRLVHTAHLAQPNAALRASFVARFATLRYRRLRFDSQSSTSSVPLLALRLAQGGGCIAELVLFCASLAVADPFRMLHPDQKLERSLQSALSSEIVVQCITDLSALLRAAPLIPEASPSLQGEGHSGIDGFLRLISGITPQSHEEEAETASARVEKALLEQIAELSRRVLLELRLLTQPPREREGQALAAVFSDVFLLDTLWDDQPPTAKTAQLNVVQFVSNELLHLEDEDSTRLRGCVVGRLVDQSTTAKIRPPHLVSCLRTMALGLWALWVRQQCGKWKRDIQQAREATEPPPDADRRRLGASAVWCALHLKTLALFRAPKDSDEVSALQLQFLEAAAVFLPRAAACAVAWGFPLKCVSVRQSRRLRALRGTLETELDSVDNDKTVVRYRSELRRVVVAAGGAASEDRADAFALCCCDRDFQRVVWTLLQRRFVVVPVSSEGNECVEMKKALQAKPSSVDGQISRHEVMRLLKTQREEIERQMERLKNVATDDRKPHTRRVVDEKTETDEQNTTDVDATPSPRRDAPKTRLTVQDLPLRQRTPSPSKPKPIQKDTSTKNVLKLLQLRKETTMPPGDMRRHQSAPQMQAVPLSLAPTLEIDVSRSPSHEQSGPKAPIKDARQHRERVLPLRFDEHADEMLLLATTGQRRTSMPLRTRSFDREPQKRPSVIEEEPPTLAATGVQCTELKSRGAQTETLEPEAPKIGAQQPIDVPLTPEPVPEAPVRAQAVAVQCREESQPVGVSGPLPASLAARFPAYVDLSNGDSSRETFLHVSKLHRATSSREMDERPRVITARWSARSSPSASPFDERSTSPVSTTHEEAVDHVHEESYEQVQARRRQTYRNHFATAGARSKQAGDRDGGLDSFLTLKTEMERMKSKLLELESCAKGLDEELKSTHQTLEAIGRRRPLDGVDSAIEKTAQSERAPHTTGALATKATRDLEDARRLLVQLESLTTTD